MMPRILVLPRQNDDFFQNEVRRKLFEHFHYPLIGNSITIVIYKPQGRPLDGIEENLSPVLRSRARYGPHLLIFKHDTYIQEDILFSQEQEWDCKVFRWRNEDDWKTICRHLEHYWRKKSFMDKLKSYVAARKRPIIAVSTGITIIYVTYILYMKMIPSDPMPSELLSPP